MAGMTIVTMMAAITMADEVATAQDPATTVADLIGADRLCTADHHPPLAKAATGQSPSRPFGLRQAPVTRAPATQTLGIKADTVAVPNGNAV